MSKNVHESFVNTTAEKYTLCWEKYVIYYSAMQQYEEFSIIIYGGRTMAKRVFTSESVTEGHPDKLCDQIADAILDCFLTRDKNARVACECVATTGMVLVMGEISSDCYVDIPSTVRKTVEEIGYTKPQ